MRKMYKILHAIVFWSYERGTWQYDVMCVAILVFIFAIPPAFFDRRNKIKKFNLNNTAIINSVNAQQINLTSEYLSLEELAQIVPSNNLKTMIEAAVLQKYDKQIVLKHYEIIEDTNGIIIGYNIWFEK